MFSLPDISGDYFLQPIVLYIVQVLIITLLTQFLSKVLKYFKQPTVIAEMVAGIMLGPSVLGRIPGFSNNFFPERSLRILEVNADIGLILYIFMVGTQIDFSLLENFTFSSFMGRSHSSQASSERVGDHRSSGSVVLQHSSSGSSNTQESTGFFSSLTRIFQLDIRRWRSMVGVPALLATAGVVVPFLCGFGIAWTLYKYPKYHGKQITFIPFGLFIGVAMAMSALAVLARMLTERRMLHQPVGTLALTTSSVGVLETWIVMGLATSFTELDYNPLDVFWSILTVISDLILLLAVLKPILSFIVRRVEREQEMSVMNFFFLIAIALGFSALCEVNGLTSSLGAMLVGMALPRSNGGQITRQALSERLEDLTSLFFLPLFFTISGIRTNFKVLQAVDWGVCVLMFFIAFISKAGTLSIVARLFNVLSFREAVSYGVLMQSKGLLALIIFNDAKTADIISDEMFSILVTYVLLSSAITLPIVDWIYVPQRLYKPSQDSDNADQHSTLVVANHPRQARAMVSIVTALVKPLALRERDQPPDRVITAKLLKDTTRFSAPFTSLSLRKDAVQKSYIRRDNVMSAARKRFSDLNAANGPLRIEQQLYVTADAPADLTEIALSNMSDLILISGPESSVLPVNNVGLPSVSLNDTELLEFSSLQSPCGIRK